MKPNAIFPVSTEECFKFSDHIHRTFCNALEISMPENNQGSFDPSDTVIEGNFGVGHLKSVHVKFFKSGTIGMTYHPTRSDPHYKELDVNWDEHYVDQLGIMIAEEGESFVAEVDKKLGIKDD